MLLFYALAARWHREVKQGITIAQFTMHWLESLIYAACADMHAVEPRLREAATENVI